MKPVLENDNGCGQGTHVSWKEHPLSAIALKHGYIYSHSTRIGAMGGDSWYLAHCFTHGKHTLSFETWAVGDEWTDHKTKGHTSCGLGSGHRHTTFSFADLEKHLAYKRKKYKL